MSIQFGNVSIAVAEQAYDERKRCILAILGTPLGWRNGDEHEVLEKFVDRVVATIKSGVPVTQTID